jgi:hypothetical protein
MDVPLATPDRSPASRTLHPPCRGTCPIARTGSPILCEGACSNLAAWLLEGAPEARRVRSRWRLRALPAVLFLLGVAVLVGCQQQTASAEAKPYAIAVKGPAAGKVGAALAATIQVTPKGEYKMNLEFPTKLKVSGPAAASPQQLELTAKQATKLTKAELLLKPTFKVSAAGSHTFKGTLRFSVCTEKQCEIKTEPVSWTVAVK